MAGPSTRGIRELGRLGVRPGVHYNLAYPASPMRGAIIAGCVFDFVRRARDVQRQIHATTTIMHRPRRITRSDDRDTEQIA